MNKANHYTSHKCTFCAQYVLHTHAIAWSKIGQEYGQFSDVILETDNCLAIAGFGALTEGYVLIIPKDHYLSVGGLPKKLMSEFIAVKQIIGDSIKKIYGQVAFFEHGMSTCSLSGGCIDHAHIHAIPCKTDFRAHLQIDFPEIQISDIFELSKFSNANISYIFYENIFEEKFVYVATETIKSQYIRRLWAGSIGKPKEWNWGIFIGEKNIARTIEKIRHDLNNEGKF
ncbi:histidine triad (HIT) protein [[Leptolyngbya] sp. PCC 7376]|uniref:HIT family protein n=1 Tax=[Leptolyngbya] sp. PCC 7376 TaxID=111781 RepID=UPI00029EF80C|nr:HIT domain-containing protein [[Leptolyngbya] sp. PCC 7376]AFY38379.1 histidine triad (HIT) protein [[Leptolyngbya] sp. PCC 7376]